MYFSSDNPQVVKVLGVYVGALVLLTAILSAL
jgi:hypothetical protein